jgi:hypothetical protein
VKRSCEELRPAPRPWWRFGVIISTTATTSPTVTVHTVLTGSVSSQASQTAQRSSIAADPKTAASRERGTLWASETSDITASTSVGELAARTTNWPAPRSGRRLQRIKG